MKWQGIRPDNGQAVEITADSEGRIDTIRPLELQPDRKLPWLSAGWIDLQVNGFAGFDFNAEQPTEADVVGVTTALRVRGVASYLPTVITGSHERIVKGLRTIAMVCRERADIAAQVPGIHLEGPYISAEDGPRGAHAREHVRKPDWDEFERFQEAADGRIALVTLAAEAEGAEAFIAKLTNAGVKVSLGHMSANEEQIRRAVDAGASFSTHLGNGAHPMMARHPNYIWSQLAEDRLWGMFIPDGHHLAPSVLKAMLRAKLNKTILVSDCVKFGGMPPGRYSSLIGSSVELLENGRLQTQANPNILAGSAYPLDRGIANAVRYTDMTLAEAVEAVTSRPARAMGLAELGSLEPGKPAHFTLFDFDQSDYALQVKETVVAGRTVYRAES